MGRRYKRREFLTDAFVVAAGSMLLKACAPSPSTTVSSPTPVASSAAPASTLKVAIALPGPITDKGWNQAGYEAMGMIKDKLGTETTYVEKVSQADQTETLSDFARRGFNLVVAHGGQFEAAVKQVAPQFPKTFFVVSDGVVTGSNIASVQVDHLQIAYLAGVVAAQMSKANKVAFLTAQSFTTTDQELRGYELGAKSINPAIEVKASYTNDWNDVSKAKEATQALLAAGVDVVYNMLDAAAPGVIQTLGEKGAYAIGYFEDQHNLAPKTVLTSAVQNYGLAIEAIAEIAKKGEMKGEIYKLGLDKSDILRLGEFSVVVPETVKQKTIAAKDNLISKKITFEDCKVGAKESWCIKGVTS